MRNAYGQLAGQNRLLIDTKVTPSGLQTVLNTESRCLDLLLKYIRNEEKSCLKADAEVVGRNFKIIKHFRSKKEFKELKSKIKHSFIFKCITNKKNKHLKFRDLFSEDTLMNLFEIFIKTVRNFDKDSNSFNFNNINASYDELKNKIEINLSFISKTVKNKDKGLNSSDENELIHSAIKEERFNSKTNELSNEQINKICKHFNLDSEKGKRKFNLLYNLHHNQASLDTDEGCIFKNIESKNAYLEPSLLPADEINQKQEKDYIKSKSVCFKKTLEFNDIKIFNSRIWNEEDNYMKLNELSKEIGKTAQALNQREKIIKENFISFCKKNLKIKNSG